MPEGEGKYCRVQFLRHNFFQAPVISFGPVAQQKTSKLFRVVENGIELPSGQKDVDTTLKRRQS